MKPPNTINKAAGKYGAFLCSKIVFFVLLSLLRHEGFGRNSCHIEIDGKKTIDFRPKCHPLYLIKKGEGRRRWWLNQPIAQKGEPAVGCSSWLVVLAWPQGLPLLNGGWPWSLLSLAWPKALHNHSSCSTPCWRQCSNRQQFVFANALLA